MPMKNNLGLLVGGTTFVLFMMEGIIHFNMGKSTKIGCSDENEKKNKGFSLPKNKELLEIALIVGIFSVINGVVVNEIKKVK